MLLYPEVRITVQSEQNILIQAPWMQSSISNWQGSLEPASLVQELWQHPHTRDLPYWFMPARRQEQLPQVNFPARVDEKEITALFDSMVDVFHWDLEPILEKSLCPDSDMVFDPLAAYASLQRCILTTTFQNSDLDCDVKKACEDPGLLLKLVHISKEVTRSCALRLSPTSHYPGPAGRVMRDFISGEDGHEAFADYSLRLLTENQNSCLMPEIPAKLHVLMKLLQASASSSPLALAACLFCFEGLSYDEPLWSPWTALAALDSRHDRAGVGKHAWINRTEAHGKVGRKLAQCLPAANFTEICLAARLTELCVQTRTQLFQDVFKGQRFH